MRLYSLIFVSLGCAFAGACADNGQTKSTFSSDFDGGGGFGGGAGAGTPGTTTSSTSSTTTTTTTTTTTSSSSGTGGMGGMGGGGTGGGTGGGGSPPLCDYAAPNTCIGATEIQQVDGDSGTDVRTLNGVTSKWFKVLIVDTNSIGGNVSYKATLVSPPGMDFDLFSYSGDNTGIDCLTNAVHAMGDPEFVTDAWNDAFASDNNKWVSLEVRYISGSACGNDAKWTLTVEGHTTP
ncbi:MAG: hypothetical protein U0359_15705 [Byssovorax sp.]